MLSKDELRAEIEALTLRMRQKADMLKCGDEFWLG